MYIPRKYRRADHVGGVRKRLAKMIVAGLSARGLVAKCEPKDLWPAQGYWRQIEQDVFSWEGVCETQTADGRWTKRSLGSWDRMSSCVRGLTIDEDGFGFEVFANKELASSDRFGIMGRIK